MLSWAGFVFGRKPAIEAVPPAQKLGKRRNEVTAGSRWLRRPKAQPLRRRVRECRMASDGVRVQVSARERLFKIRTRSSRVGCLIKGSWFQVSGFRSQEKEYKHDSTNRATH